MKLFRFLSIITAVSIFLTGCSPTKIVSGGKPTSIFQIGGCEYKDKYYYRNEDTIKVFDEKTKNSDYVCQKSKCIHEEGDKTCIAYAFGALAFVATQKYLYVFIKDYSSPELSHIDRIDLKDGSCTLYSDESNFNSICNAFLYDNKVFFSDLLPDGGCAVKVFDIEKRTIKFITNEQEDWEVFSWVNGIADDILYFREDYHGKKTYIRDGLDPDYDFMGMPSWYSKYIVSTSLFTYNLNTNNVIRTTKDIDQFGNTYYDKGFYYVDKNNNARRIDWTNGKNELIASSDNISVEFGEEVQFHPFGYNNKLGISTFRKGKLSKTKVRGTPIIGKQFLYDIAAKELQPYNIDDNEMVFVIPESNLDNGLIISFDTKSKRTTQYAYITKSDYYGGKMNLIEFK